MHQLEIRRQDDTWRTPIYIDNLRIPNIYILFSPTHFSTLYGFLAYTKLFIFIIILSLNIHLRALSPPPLQFPITAITNTRY
jgi:hypothetical protein